MSVRHTNPDAVPAGGGDYLKSLLAFKGEVLHKDHSHRTVINTTPLISGLFGTEDCEKIAKAALLLKKDNESLSLDNAQLSLDKAQLAEKVRRGSSILKQENARLRLDNKQMEEKILREHVKDAQLQHLNMSDEEIMENNKEAEFGALEIKFRKNATKEIQSDVNKVDTADYQKWLYSMKSLYRELNNEAVELWDDVFTPRRYYIPWPDHGPIEAPEVTSKEVAIREQEARNLRWGLVFLYQNLDEWAKLLYHADTMRTMGTHKIVIEDNGQTKNGLTTPAIFARIKKYGPLFTEML